MPDREKVIKGLESCVTDYLTQDNCKICPYGNGYDTGYCWVEMNTDALELLKEQKAETIECKMCGHRLQKDWNWCPWCRWEIRQGYNADELS